MTDEKLIELFFERSEQAVAAMDEKYGRLCRKLAGNILGSDRDAEECVNDAYLAVWNSIPPERPQRLTAYVCRIVRNISLNRFHRNTAAKRSSSYETALEELEAVLPAADTVEDEFDSRELKRIIEGFLDTLSDEGCAVFMGRYWFAESYEDIAKRTGLTVKNVSVKLTRIRRQLKNYLEERGVHYG